MHRILNIASNEENNFDLIEQPKADIIFLTSVKADIKLLYDLIDNDIGSVKNNMRALHLSFLKHPSQIDHYILKTISKAKVVVVRIFGDKGVWSYGLEQLSIWSKTNLNNKLIVLSGTEEQDIELNELSNIDLNLSHKLSLLLREGGKVNYLKFLKSLNFILKNNFNIPNNYLISKKYNDPILFDWKKEEGRSVAIISYKSLFLANEIELSENLNKYLRSKGFKPRTVFISTLKDSEIQNKLINLFKKENIEIILTTTSFDSSLAKHKNNGKELSFLEILNVPVLQLLTSSISRKDWHASSIGMNSIDLLMQIIIPEFDSRIITVPCSFKEIKTLDNNLCTEITTYKYDKNGIIWITKLISNYLKLSNLKNIQKKICLVISNYPVKNGRLANGVGLNTPQTLINILNWLKKEGYNTGKYDEKMTSKQLMSMIIKRRTNDPASSHNKPLDYLKLEEYQFFWDDLPNISKEKIIERWNLPKDSIDLENEGFSINGINFGNVCILIQPSREYDSNSLKDIHSPDLPPPHRYLAQYYWIENKFKTNAICHVGKHGTLEWLPGKSVGLSMECFPRIINPPVPIIYPFIVNDPGEGAQAKRRIHATIIDHLTPPLDRSGLYGYLYELELLIDEYYESKLLDNKRSLLIKKQIEQITLKDLKNIFDINKSDLVEELDSYLCELKENQIRVGLHTFGSKPEIVNELNLISCIARVPTSRRNGLTQYLADSLNLELDPWTNDYNKKLSINDQNSIYKLSKKKIFTLRKAIEFLEKLGEFLLVSYFFNNDYSLINLDNNETFTIFNDFLEKPIHKKYFHQLGYEIINPLRESSKIEKKSFIRSLESKYIKSGPSGAPTRGKLEVLPTGKNFYSIDTRGIPTETAWMVGDKSAQQILELYKQENGIDLKRMAITVWATSTMRNGGEDICQILSLMGVKPVWDGPTRKITDLEIIPLTVLSRPRVDVTLRISGMFRDSFPQLIYLITKAVDLVSNLNEKKEDNPLVKSNKESNSVNRIFGSAPGSYGAGLQEYISNSNWNDNDDLGEAYLNWSCWKYDKNAEAEYSKEEFESILKKIQLVMQNQDNREHDILDSDDYYQFQGGITSAIKKLSGSYPEVYHGDLSKFSNSKVTKLSKEIQKVVLSRVLNPKWINGMKKNGYKGCFEFSATLDYLYAYDATTNLVSNWCYEKIYNSWLEDKELKKFFEIYNPWALKDIAERFLEIINRKMWLNASDEKINNLKLIINNTESLIEKNKF
mgnify:FL=1